MNALSYANWNMEPELSTIISMLGWTVVWTNAGCMQNLCMGAGA
ncbi:MAG: hypothetical protein AB1714_14575 [Acidobacteriota bacterium]